MFNKIIINKSNLINNICAVKNSNPKTKICAMVKANAYGVGTKQAVTILSDIVDFFAVSCEKEAAEVAQFTNKKILIVGPSCSYNKNFSYSCGNLGEVKAAIAKNKKINIHLKVNTGMNRYGFKTLKQFYAALLLIKNSKLNLEGVFTHYATADRLVEVQTKKFNKFVNLCFYLGFKPIVHADNSAVSLNFNHNFDMIRLGFNLFLNSTHPFKAAVCIKSKIVQTHKITSGELVGYNYRYVAEKDKRVAILPVGYADGLDMHLLGFNLIIKHFKCKILNICMDSCMIDITNTNLKLGDEVYILNKRNSLKSYADYLKTHEYEIATKFSHLRGQRIIKK